MDKPSLLGSMKGGVCESNKDRGKNFWKASLIPIEVIWYFRIL
jgi:hypothetical protein